MDFSPSDTQKEIAGLARKIFRARCTPEQLKALERGDKDIHDELWSDLANAGLLGTAVPDEFGGSGLGVLELCSLMVEAGAAVAPVPLWSTLFLGALPVAEFGDSSQKRRLLPAICSGQSLLSAALGEYPQGLASAANTQARRDGNDWVLSGVKTCVPAAARCQRILLPATHAANDGRIGIFLVDPNADGVVLQPQQMTNLERQYQVTLDGVRVADSDVLGDPDSGDQILHWIRQRATIGLCAMELGVVGHVLRMTAAYTSERKQFDRPIATFQAVSQRAGDMWIDVETVKLATWEAAFRVHAGLAADEHIAIAKFWAAEAGHRVVYAAQHLHGGIGFDLDYPLGRYYTRSKMIELTLGSAAVQLETLGAYLAAE